MSHGSISDSITVADYNGAKISFTYHIATAAMPGYMIGKIYNALSDSTTTPFVPYQFDALDFYDVSSYAAGVMGDITDSITSVSGVTLTSGGSGSDIEIFGVNKRLYDSSGIIHGGFTYSPTES